MEVSVTFRFQCLPEHVTNWKIVFEMLGGGQVGWQLQDAIDPISVNAADMLDDVWDALPYGNQSFEVTKAQIDGFNCVLQFSTGDMVIEQLKKELINWLEICPVNHIECIISSVD